ncbi:hypothetical protein CDAR_168951 [Caerostris darwini]|uniref:Uncharacterized protein n=1 Tax=Caerostris darwini TaxID=1538125 RepID=A0AAV4WQL8_9ARAC|nr:hypothetical protein CDAR_168951 [Caerostris darwini]
MMAVLEENPLGSIEYPISSNLARWIGTDIENIIQILQRSTEHEQPLAKQRTFAKARKRRRMRLIKTDKRQKGMAVVFLGDCRQHNTSTTPSGVRERSFAPAFVAMMAVLEDVCIGSALYFVSDFVE